MMTKKSSTRLRFLPTGEEETIFIIFFYNNNRFNVYIFNHHCRPDLLCLEGISQALSVFNKKQEMPTYRLADRQRRDA